MAFPRYLEKRWCSVVFTMSVVPPGMVCSGGNQRCHRDEFDNKVRVDLNGSMFDQVYFPTA